LSTVDLPTPLSPSSIFQVLPLEIDFETIEGADVFENDAPDPGICAATVSPGMVARVTGRVENESSRRRHQIPQCGETG